jgi:hypothetical protein
MLVTATGDGRNYWLLNNHQLLSPLSPLSLSKKKKNRIVVRRDTVSTVLPEVSGSRRDSGDMVTASGPDSALERRCGTCSRSTAAMVEMLPGRFGPPGVWLLCGTCYGTPGERAAAPVRFGRGKPVRVPGAAGELLDLPPPRAESSGDQAGGR